jgi:uncharacterized protein YhjY with autotransporter beta-barrel domain
MSLLLNHSKTTVTMKQIMKNQIKTLTVAAVAAVCFTSAALAAIDLDFVYDPTAGQTTATYSGNWETSSTGDPSTSVQHHITETAFTRLHGQFGFTSSALVGAIPWTSATALSSSGSNFGFIMTGYIYGPALFTPATPISGALIFDGDLDSLGFDSAEITNGGTISSIGGSVNWTASVMIVPFTFAGIIGLDPELAQIAKLIDDNLADAGLIPIINELNLLMEGDQPAAFEQINPQELTALAHFTTANARSNSLRLKNRQREVRHGATGFSTTGFSLYDETGQYIRQSLLADNSGTIPASTLTQGLGSESKLSSYISGSGTMRDFDSDSNGPGYEDDSFAVLLGADYHLADNLALGAYIGYNHTNADLGGDGGNAELDSYRLGLTGTHWNPLSDGSGGIQRSYYTTAHAGLALHDYATDRKAFGGTAKGDTDAFEFNLGSAIGYEVDYTDFVLTTELSLDYVNLDTDGFTEMGSAAPLAIADVRSESLYSTLSVRLDFSYQIADVDVLPYTQIGWRHEFMDDSNSVAARFASSPGVGGFTVEGPKADRNSLVGSLGMAALLSDSLTASVGYFGEFGPNFQSHSLNGSITLKF